MVKVIDTKMGGYKTSWAIQYMNRTNLSENKRFIFVTPFLSEVNRIKKSCGFDSPEATGNRSKLQSFKSLMVSNKNIVTTHQLFQILDGEAIDLLKSGYTLILDEVLDVVKESTLKKGDIRNLLDLGILTKDADGNLKTGNEEIIADRMKEDSEYRSIMNNLLRHNIEILTNTNKRGVAYLLWLFPIDVISSFDEVIIMTFNFNGYPLKGYLDVHNIQQEKYSVEVEDTSVPYVDRVLKLIPYVKPNIQEVSKLVNIIEIGKVNDIGDNKNAMSTSWWGRRVSDEYHEDWMELKRNLSNFLVNFAPSKSKKRIIWTTFKNAKHGVYTPILTDENFLAHNVRATNEYKDRDVVLYLVNRFHNPIITRWFESKGITINENDYALGEMMQYIWRSAIREGNEIWVYIPSKRMRDLLKDWLEN